MPKDKKVIAIYRLMGKFLEDKEISAYDKGLLEEFGCSSKTLGRYLENIEQLYSHIIKIKKGKKSVWHLLGVSDVFEEFIRNHDDISTLFSIAKDADPEILKELEQNTLKKVAKERDIFIFKNYIMEELREPRVKEYFKDLKNAVKNREYRDIYYQVEDKELQFIDAKPIKLVFVDNNWYIATVDKKDMLHILRISFINKIEHRASQGRFQEFNLEPYIEFLKDIQNGLTLYGAEKKTAVVKATPKIAQYFKENMKKFMPSQKFLKEQSDGSVLFSLEYTQELEVLILIQRWLPDLIILEPKELQQAYIKKLQKMLERQGSE